MRSWGECVLVKVDLGALRNTSWREYATRFLFGGTVTLLAGLIADKFGPGIGGLFLAFPAIFPASASLIEKHEQEKKKNAGLDGTMRGRIEAGVDASGTAIGCVGLAAFAIATWKLLPHLGLWLTLMTATLCWAVTAGAVWFVRKRLL